MFLALFTCLTFANALHYKGMRGVNWFCAYSLCVFFGALGVALRGSISDPISIFFGTVPVSMGYLCLATSIRDFFERARWNLYLQIFLVVVMTIGMLQYGVFVPDTGKRLLIYSSLLFAQQLHIAVLLSLNRNPTLRTPATCMLLMMCGLTLSNLTRFVGIVLRGAPHNYLDASGFLAWSVVINSCLQGGIMIAYVWMTAALLRGKLEVQAFTDPLTGALNRRGMEQSAEQRILQCHKDHQPLVAAVIDLDRFKFVNDTYGHHCGDATLITVAACLQRGLRSGDLLGRIGGDEFAILLPNTTSIEAAEIIERLRLAVAATDIVYGQIRTRVTASFGVAEMGPEEGQWEQLFLLCDRMLYAEKRVDRTPANIASLGPQNIEALP